jgi:hypothetical protein
MTAAETATFTAADDGAVTAGTTRSGASDCGAASCTTGTMKRYPRRASVSIKMGVSADSMQIAKARELALPLNPSCR